MASQVVQAIEWTFLAYFVAINVAYLGQCLFAVASVLVAALFADDEPT